MKNLEHVQAEMVKEHGSDVVKSMFAGVTSEAGFVVVDVDAGAHISWRGELKDTADGYFMRHHAGHLRYQWDGDVAFLCFSAAELSDAAPKLTPATQCKSIEDLRLFLPVFLAGAGKEKLPDKAKMLLEAAS